MGNGYALDEESQRPEIFSEHKKMILKELKRRARQIATIDDAVWKFTEYAEDHAYDQENVLAQNMQDVIKAKYENDVEQIEHTVKFIKEHRNARILKIIVENGHKVHSHEPFHKYVGLPSQISFKHSRGSCL